MTPAVIDASALYMVLTVLTGWLDRQVRKAIGLRECCAQGMARSKRPVGLMLGLTKGLKR